MKCMIRTTLITIGMTIGMSAFLALAIGCGAKISVSPIKLTDKNEYPDKEAIPYFLPKPYLLVTKNFGTASNKITKTTKKDGTIVEVTEPISVSPMAGAVLYNYRVIYLPDLERAFGITIERGTGTYDADVTLKDGWQFTGFNVKGDSQTDEIVVAAGSLLGSVAEGIAKGATPGGSTIVSTQNVEADLILYDLSDFKCKFSWPNNCSKAGL